MKCEFWKVCFDYRREAVVCNSGGGDYCGGWRELKNKINKHRNFDVLEVGEEYYGV